jgi:molybdopterin synthase sulfur carrier subunit
MAKVRLSGSLRQTVGRAEVKAEGATVGEVLGSLARAHAGLEALLFDAKGGLRRHVGVYLNGEDVRFGQGLEAAVSAGDEITVLQAMAGG